MLLSTKCSYIITNESHAVEYAFLVAIQLKTKKKKKKKVEDRD